MRWSAIIPCLFVLLTAAAPPRTDMIGLVPPATDVTIRVYGLGLMPIDGRFSRFRGTLSYDGADRMACRIELSAEVASLVLPSVSIQDAMTGPEFMDAARYPLLTFTGACDGNHITGRLEMHGVTHPLELSLDRRTDQLVAVGRLLRSDWGMTARPFTVGRTVRITVTVALPGTR